MAKGNYYFSNVMFTYIYIFVLLFVFVCVRVCFYSTAQHCSILLACLLSNCFINLEAGIQTGSSDFLLRGGCAH